MSYNQMVSEIVKNSRLTLKEVAEGLKQYHVNIDPSYISKLQSPGQPPASDEVNIALAKVCNADPDDLLFEAYRDKAPEAMRRLIDQILTFLRKFIRVTIMTQLPPDMAQMAEEQVNKITDLELIKMINEEELTGMLDDITDIITFKDLNDQDTNIMLNPHFGLTMPDNSMEPLIPEGARIQLDKADTVNNGDIVVAIISKDNYVIRRCIVIDKKYALIAENTNFEPLTISKKSLKIIGKVKSYSKEL